MVGANFFYMPELSEVGNELPPGRWDLLVSGRRNARRMAKEKTAADVINAVRNEKTSDKNPTVTGPTIIPASPDI